MDFSAFIYSVLWSSTRFIYWVFMVIEKEELYAQLVPVTEEDYLKILAGTDRSFLAQFLPMLRAIFQGDFRKQRQNRRSGQPYYDYLRGGWYNANGVKMHPEKEIRQEIRAVQNEVLQITRELMRSSTVDNHGRPSIPQNLIDQWLIRVGKKIVNANVRAYAIGYGDRPNFENLFEHLGNELGYLANFGNDVNNGTLRRYSVEDRVKMYADSILLSYSQGDVDKKRDEAGMWEGWRQLDPGYDHCPDCPNYVTDGFIDSEDIMPIGCCSVCGRHCKCTITWRRKKDAYYQDLANLSYMDLAGMDKAKIAEINFRYYKNMGLSTKEQARRYSILKRRLGHHQALSQVKQEYSIRK